jgi:hypothetical protein
LHSSTDLSPWREPPQGSSYLSSLCAIWSRCLCFAEAGIQSLLQNSTQQLNIKHIPNQQIRSTDTLQAIYSIAEYHHATLTTKTQHWCITSNLFNSWTLSYYPTNQNQHCCTKNKFSHPHLLRVWKLP